jgi:hypothetical protein
VPTDRHENPHHFDSPEAPTGDDPEPLTQGLGLEVSLTGAQDKLAQLDAERIRRDTVVDLGIPTFHDIAGRDGTSLLRPE